MAEAGDWDYDLLDKQLNRLKTQVFKDKRAAFFGPLMASMGFYWSNGVKTACTDGANVWWNPEFFLDGPTKYHEPKFNHFVLRHELWHPARLHLLRQGDRDSNLWNYACDVRINNDLKTEGYSWGSFNAWYMPHLDTLGKGPMVEEDIYDHLFGKGFIVPENPWGEAEFMDPDPEANRKCINNVVKAKTEAELADDPESIPGGTKGMLDHFLAPIIPWEQHLWRFMKDLARGAYTWRRPRRRLMAQKLYLPSRYQDEGRLAHLVYGIDVSGSITEQEIQRFNSELKYVWDVIKPKRMTIFQFDDIIQKVDEYKVGDAFARVEIIGRGGNTMEPVARFIEEMDPTAAIIFTDLQYQPMRKLKKDIPVLWVVNHQNLTPPYGELIRINVKAPRPFR